MMEGSVSSRRTPSTSAGSPHPAGPRSSLDLRPAGGELNAVQKDLSKVRVTWALAFPMRGAA